MKQLSLVALYGQKSKTIKKLIVSVWKEIEKSSMKRVFKRSAINQIHSTIMGMEKVIGYQKSYNANHWKKNGEKKLMDFNKLYDHINSHLPLNIQIGGFKKSNTDFKSFGKTPYYGSLTIPVCESTKKKKPTTEVHASKKRFLRSLFYSSF